MGPNQQQELEKKKLMAQQQLAHARERAEELNREVAAGEVGMLFEEKGEVVKCENCGSISFTPSETMISLKTELIEDATKDMMGMHDLKYITQSGMGFVACKDCGTVPFEAFKNLTNLRDAIDGMGKAPPLDAQRKKEIAAIDKKHNQAKAEAKKEIQDSKTNLINQMNEINKRQGGGQ